MKADRIGFVQRFSAMSAVDAFVGRACVIVIGECDFVPTFQANECRRVGSCSAERTEFAAASKHGTAMKAKECFFFFFG